MLQNFKDARASGLFFKILNKPHPYFNCLVKYYYTRKYLCNVSIGSYYTIPFTIKLFAFLFLHAKGNSLRAIRLHRLTRIENILHVLDTFSAVHVVISPRDILSLLRFVLAIYLCFFFSEPHSSVAIVQDLEQEVAGSISALPTFLSRIDDSHCDRVHSSPTAVNCFDYCYVGKQPVVWKKHCAEYWFKELQESMGRCTGRRDIKKTALNIFFSLTMRVYI